MIEIQVSGLIKSYEIGKNVLDGLTFQIDQGERVGLLGRNGAGKSTLFKILTGELDYDEGEVTVGQGRRTGLISQIPVYPAGYTVEDVLRSAFARLQKLAQEMETLTERMAAGETEPAILRRYGALSERFEAFGGYDTDVAVNKIANGLSISREMREQLFENLSGGEKTRVNLARLLLEKTDILLLDEPTNHLDLNSVEWLEQYINAFKGTVLAISHDRYFINQTATRIMDLVNGTFVNYIGNYDYYLEKKEELTAAYTNAVAAAVPTSAPVESETKLDWKAQKEAQAKERKRQNDLKKVEERIGKLEERDQEIDDEMSKPEIFTNSVKCQELSKEKADILEELEQLYEQWELLAE